MTGKYYIGIDGCPGGWFYTVIDYAGVCICGVASDMNWIWEKYQNAALMLIDIPIGLSDSASRTCDIEARKCLGPGQSARVFPPPCRRAVYADTYRRACEINQRQTGKKISRQTWNINPKIREADVFLRTNPAAVGNIRESHPEVCFRVLAKGPLKFSKKRSEGVCERLEVLAAHLPGVLQAFESALKRFPRKAVSRDDILDSMVTAVTARYASRCAKTLPARPQRDAAGLPMEIVYAAVSGHKT